MSRELRTGVSLSEINVSGRCRSLAAGALRASFRGAGAQQQMRLASCWEPTEEVQRRLLVTVYLSFVVALQRLQPSFEGDHRWRRGDVRWQTVLNASCGDCEGAVADGDATRKLERRCGTGSTTTVHVCHTAQFACKVCLRRRVCKNCALAPPRESDWRPVRVGLISAYSKISCKFAHKKKRTTG